MQRQFDTSLAQMVKILVNQEAEEDDEIALQQDAAKDMQQAGEESQISNLLLNGAMNRGMDESSKVNV